MYIVCGFEENMCAYLRQYVVTNEVVVAVDENW